MMDMKMAATGQSGLVQVWITVTDADGSSRLESRWTSAEPVAALHASHAA